jgi:hypothetical protein
VRAPVLGLAFELNLDTGERMDDHLGLDPAEEAAHWFLLDLAAAREHSIGLAGPPLPGLVGPVPPGQVLEALERPRPGAAAALLARAREAVAAARTRG